MLSIVVVVSLLLWLASLFVSAVRFGLCLDIFWVNVLSLSMLFWLVLVVWSLNISSLLRLITLVPLFV